MTVAKKATRAPRTRTPRKISDLSERERAQIGPLVAKRKGTAEWCWQAVELLKDRIRYVEDDWRKVQDVIDMLKAEEAWKTIPPEKPYGTFAALLREELGLSEEQIDEQIRNDGLAPIGPKGVDTTTTTTTPYRDAAITLWGDAGAYVHDAYRRHLHLFPELPDELPIVIGLTAYGKCSGLTRGGWEHGPRISVASNLFAKGARVVDDLLVHEMLHAQLHITGRNTKHDSADWYEAIQRLSPAVLGHEIDVRRGAGRKSVRVVDADGVSRVRKVKVAEHEGMHDKVSRWPSPFRPIGYDWGAPIDCPSY